MICECDVTFTSWSMTDNPFLLIQIPHLAIPCTRQDTFATRAQRTISWRASRPQKAVDPPGAYEALNGAQSCCYRSFFVAFTVSSMDHTWSKTSPSVPLVASDDVLGAWSKKAGRFLLVHYGEVKGVITGRMERQAQKTRARGKRENLKPAFLEASRLHFSILLQP